MKIINKSVFDLYPNAEVIFEYNELDELAKFIDYFGFVILITAILFFYRFILHNLLWFFVIICLWCIWIFWSEHLIKKVYRYNNVFIFIIYKKWCLIIPSEEITYILLRGYKYDNNQLYPLKWGFHSSHPGIIIQVGLFRFILRYTDINLFANYNLSFINLFEKFIVKLDMNDKIINNYDIILNWKHQTIEMKLHFNRFICMIKYIFIKPIAMIFKK